MDLPKKKTFFDTFIGIITQESDSLLSSIHDNIIGFDATDDSIIFTSIASQVAEDFSVTTDEIKTVKSQIATQIFNEDNTTLRMNSKWIKEKFTLNNETYVGYFFTVPQQNMVVLLSTTNSYFSEPVRKIIISTIIVIVVSIILSIIIIILFSNSLVTPLQSMLRSMEHIITNNSFDEKVDVLYKDEIGKLSVTFNLMVSELDIAYKQIKQYAFTAILARKNESKIRNIFQKYVPVSVINSLFEDPTRLLMGENREVAIMFTDIRNFTTISEGFDPEKLVRVLNSYFEKLVDIITKNGGIIDKYIGDAIMAFFGAPMPIENSPHAAITAALDMVRTLKIFNQSLTEKGLPSFITGIGINYGLVTVGNIGSEKKMDYTAIGDAVNLGSRLEGLTKVYKQDLIFSHSVQEHVYDTIPCRLVDIVQVKGKTTGEKIYTAPALISDTKTKRVVTNKIINIYGLNNEGVKYYLARDFKKAANTFKKILAIDPNDHVAKMFIKRCQEYSKITLDDNWSGIAVMTTK